MNRYFRTWGPERGRRAGIITVRDFGTNRTNQIQLRSSPWIYTIQFSSPSKTYPTDGYNFYIGFENVPEKFNGCRVTYMIGKAVWLVDWVSFLLRCRVIGPFNGPFSGRSVTSKPYGSNTSPWYRDNPWFLKGWFNDEQSYLDLGDITGIRTSTRITDLGNSSVHILSMIQFRSV